MHAQRSVEPRCHVCGQLAQAHGARQSARMPAAVAAPAHRLTSTPWPCPTLPPSISTSLISHSPMSHWQVSQVAQAFSCGVRGVDRGAVAGQGVGTVGGRRGTGEGGGICRPAGLRKPLAHCQLASWSWEQKDRGPTKVKGW